MSTSSGVGLSLDGGVLRTLRTVLPALNLKVIAPPAPLPNAETASPAEIRVVVVDADFPDSAGVLKWLEPGREIPVILIREEGAPHSRAPRGAAAVLSKPVDPNKLRAAVELVVPDWEDLADREPRMAEILDLFGPKSPAADPPDRGSLAKPTTAANLEDEIERLLEPALAEVGIRAKRIEPSSPFPADPPRPHDPPSARPKTMGLPSTSPVEPPPERKAAGIAPGRLPSPPKIKTPVFSNRAGGAPHPEPMAEETESLFASFGASHPKKERRPHRIFLAAGLAVIALIGAAYLGFGRRTPKPAPAPSTTAAPQPVEQAAARSDAPAEGGIDTALSLKATTREEPKQPDAKSEGSPESLFESGPPRLPAAIVLKNDTIAPIKAPAPVVAKSEPDTAAPAVVNPGLKNESAEKSEVAAKTKTEALPALPKDVPKPGPAPAKNGDLVDLAAVDRFPVLLKSVEPAYPPLAFQKKLEAKVTLAVLISEKGEVLDAKIAGDASVDMGFVKAALRAVQRWSYSPALKDGAAVRVWKTVIIDFRIR